MKLFYAKKDHVTVCLRCRTTLARGEIYVRIGYNKDGHWGFLFYHPACYLEVVNDKLNRRLQKFTQETNPPKKRGRRPLYRQPREAQRLRCLLNYHKKLEHWDRIDDLENKLRELKGDV